MLDAGLVDPSALSAPSVVASRLLQEGVGAPTTIGAELPVPVLDPATLPALTDVLAPLAGTPNELTLEDVFIRCVEQTREEGKGVGLDGLHLLSDGAAPTNPHPPTHPRTHPQRSWMPANSTSGQACEMTNSADLPEAFLLVSSAESLLFCWVGGWVGGLACQTIYVFGRPARSIPAVELAYIAPPVVASLDAPGSKAPLGCA